MPKHINQFTFKGKRKNIAKVYTKYSISKPTHTDIEILHGSKDHAILPDTIKITFILDIESTDKTQSIVKNVGRALVKKVANAWIKQN